MKVHKFIFVLLFIAFSANISESSDNKEPFYLSRDFGSVKKYYNSSCENLIYHIHDAHCKADAQLNIANIIERIIAHHGSAVIAIEGASGPIYAENFRQFPDKKVLKDVAKYFLDKGFISGSEYYFLNSKKTVPFVGIENSESYKKNYSLILQSIDAQPKAIEAVNNLIEAQLNYSVNIFNELQQEFLNNWISYNQHELLLDKYIPYLISIIHKNNKYDVLNSFCKIIRQENKINFAIVEQQRLKFLDWITSNADKDVIKEVFQWDIRYKLNKTSSKNYFRKLISWINQYQQDSINESYFELKKYADLLLESESINKSSLYAELIRAINESARIVFNNDKSFSAFELIQTAHLYKSLITLSINYEKFMRLSEQPDFVEFTKSLRLIFPQINIDPDSTQFLKKAVSVSHMFYKHALDREVYMVENCLDEMAEKQLNVGIIVTGGFHEQGISRELKRRDISFCSIEPAIKETSIETSYFSLVQNFMTPLENWVAGSTLAVASWIAETPLVDDGIKEVRTNIFSSLLTADYIRELSPANIDQIRGQLDLLIANANTHLENWLNEYAPAVSLESVELIGNKLAVHINVGRRKLVYLFSEPKIPGSIVVSRKEALEEGQISRFQVDALTEDIIGKLRQIARVEKISGGEFYSIKDVKNIVEQLGIQTELANNQLSLSLIDFAVNDYNYKNDVSLNLSNLYHLYKYVADDFLTPEDIKALSDITVGKVSEDVLSELNPQDLLDECYSMLRNSYSEKPVIKVADLKSGWKDVLISRGISDILVDPTLPFESLVSMIFALVFSAEIEPGTMHLGDIGGKHYFTRLIKLTDGTLFARLGNSDILNIKTPFWSEAEYKYQSQLPLPLDEGLITLEVDGGFVISSVIRIDRKTLKTQSTKIRASINGIMRGDEGASQLRALLQKHKEMAITEGLHPTGFIIRDQEKLPLYFSDLESLLVYFKEIKGATYEPVKQSDWTETAGGFTRDEFTVLTRDKSIRYSDSVDPMNMFWQLDALIPIDGARILDVGSQTGQNVFYFYLQGAEFTVGLDFNPYNVMVAREISAYIHENEYTSSGIGFNEHTLSEFAVMENGASKGHLYFRTMSLKDMEAEEGRTISHKPPENIEFAIGDARHIQYPSDSFDISNAVNLLQYIDNASLSLKEMIRVTRPGGFVQFNYGIRDEDNADFVKEAVMLFERDEGITVDYNLVELPSGIFPLPLYVIQIKSKSPLIDLSGEVDFIKNHRYKRAFYENDFDSKPYLGTLYPPVNIIPQELNIIAQGKLNDVRNISGLSNSRRFNLTFVKMLMLNIYGAEIFGKLRDIEIEKGRKSFVYIQGYTLVINEVALDNPLILFMQMEQLLTGNIELTGIDDLMSDPLYPLHKEAALVYRSILKMISRLTQGELEYLVWSLRASNNPDTDLEMESIMLGDLLELAANPKTKPAEVVDKIIEGFVSLPKFDYLNVIIPQALKQGKLKHSSFASVVRIAQEIDDNSGEMEGVAFLINKLAPNAIETDNPFETSRGLLNFFEWKNELDKSSKPLPYNLENIFNNKTVGKILASYPVAGNIVIEDLVKIYLSNPLYSAKASFFSKLSSIEIIDIIENLEKNYSQEPDLLFEILVKAQELSNDISIKSLRDVLLGELPLDSLNARLEQKEPDANLEADVHWLNFLPYFEQLIREKKQLPPNFILFTNINTIDEIYKNYPGTGFFILTEFAKSFLKKSDDMSEFLYLAEFSDADILRLIENTDNFIRKHSEYRYNSLSSPLYLPAQTWVGPRLHNYLVQENGGKPYEIIEVRSHAGIDSVEGMEELFNDIRVEVEEKGIDQETVVLVKIADYYVTADDVPVYTFILVADKLKNIYTRTDITRIRLETGAHLGKNLFEFKIHYLPESNEIGDVVVQDISGDERAFDWYIALAKEDERSKGIGSEFLRNYFAIHQFLGLNNIPVQSTAHAISTFKILTREVNAEFDEDLSDNMVGNHEATYFKYSSLLFRLGILNEDDFNAVRINSKDTDRVKSILDNAIDNSLLPGESKAGLLVRKSDDLLNNTVRLERLINIYSVLLQDDLVAELIPSIKNDYSRLESFINLRKTEDVSYYSPELLFAENTFFKSLSDLEDRLLGYFMDNPSNVLDTYMYLLDFQPDSRQIFNDLNYYFEQSFSYTSMRGKIPGKLNEANLPFLARMFLTRSLPLTDIFSTDVIKQALLADEPDIEIERRLSELKTLAQIRTTLKELLMNVTRFETSPWRESIIEKVLTLMNELGMPVKPFLSVKKDFMDLFLDQPFGTWRLLAYIAESNVKAPDETKKFINKLRTLDNDKFKFVLDTLASSPQARVIRKSLPAFVNLVSKGVIPTINSVRSDFGRLGLLSDENIVITKDTSVSQYMILKGFNDKAPANNGYNLYEKAFELVDLLAEKKVKAIVVKGRVHPDASVEHFVRTESLIISVKPYGLMFVDSLENEVQSPGGLFTDETLPFLNEPLFWQSVSDKQGVLFNGGVKSITKGNTNYLDISVSASDIQNNKRTGEKSYLLRIPANRLLDLYYSAMSNPEIDITQLIHSYSDVYFGLQTQEGDLDQLDLYSDTFNESFAKILRSLDPEWMMNFVNEQVVNQIKFLSSTRLQESLSLIPYSNVSNGAKQIIADLYYQQSDKTVDKNTLLQGNEKRQDFNIIFINDIPIGAVEKGNVAILQDTIPENLANFIGKTVIHSLANGVTTFQRSNNVGKAVLPLINLKFNDRMDWVVDTLPGMGETINIDNLNSELESALSDISFFGDELASLNINFRVVEGSPTLAERSPELPDGSVTVSIDIDAFRNRLTLAFVLQHVMRDVTALNLEGYISNEVTALVNDMKYFQELMPDERSQLTKVFRHNEVGLSSFADLLESLQTLPKQELIKTIIKYVADSNVYPQFKSVLSDMDDADIAVLAASQLNRSLSERLSQAGYNPFEILVILTQPDANIIEPIINLIDSYTQDSAYGLSQNIISDIFLGEFSHSDISNLVTVFYDSLDDSGVGLQEIEQRIDLWSSLFFRLGVGSISELLNSINNKQSRFLPAKQLFESMEDQTANMRIDSFNIGETKSIEVVYQDGLNNVSLKYSATGELLARQEFERSTYDKLLPRLIHEQTELTEHFFGKDIDFLISLMEPMIEADVQSRLFKDNLETVTSIFQELSDRYNTYPRASVLSVPVSRQEAMKSVVYQFVSDLLGTPLSSARGGVDLVPYTNDEDKKISFVSRSLDSLREIRENMVKFRMMQEFYISNRKLPMMVFKETFSKPENQPFLLHNFSVNSDLENAVKKQLAKSAENNVYAVICEGKNPSALAWISTLQNNLLDKPGSKIVVVSTVLDSTQLESILSSTGIDISNLIILGNEVINIQMEKNENSDELDELVNLVSVNCGISQDKLVFLSSETNVVGKFLNHGISILPMPDIQQTPLPVRKKFPSMDLYENAA